LDKKASSGEVHHHWRQPPETMSTPALKIFEALKTQARHHHYNQTIASVEHVVNVTSFKAMSTMLDLIPTWHYPSGGDSGKKNYNFDHHTSHAQYKEFIFAIC
jgi:hypothetical protein